MEREQEREQERGKNGTEERVEGRNVNAVRGGE